MHKSRAAVMAPLRLRMLVEQGLLPKTALILKRRRGGGAGSSNSGPVGKKLRSGKKLGRMQAVWALQAKTRKKSAHA